MGEAKKRKMHTAEFKAKVRLEALRGVKTINEIGQAYGIHPAQVGQRRRTSPDLSPRHALTRTVGINTPTIIWAEN
jgi:transposase-like protein